MRRGDTDKNRTYFRAGSRLFHVNGQWYFTSREGDQGPFDSEREAMQEIARHTQATQNLSPFAGAQAKGTPIKTAPAEPNVVVDRRLRVVDRLPTQPESRPHPAKSEMESIADLDNTSLRSYRQRAHAAGD